MSSGPINYYEKNKKQIDDLINEYENSSLQRSEKRNRCPGKTPRAFRDVGWNIGPEMLFYRSPSRCSASDEEERDPPLGTEAVRRPSRRDRSSHTSAFPLRRGG